MISLIIPTKNEEKVIAETLRALGEIPVEKEIIVSDGGSTDATVSIARTLADVVVEKESNVRQTIAGGRNAGARVARGDLLVFVDADVAIQNPKHFFDEVVRQMDAIPGCVAATVPIRVYDSMATVADVVVFASLNFGYKMLNNVLRAGSASGEFQIIRRDAFEAVGGYDEKMAAGEDVDMFRRLGKIGRTVFLSGVEVRHTGRRAHVTGWPKLLWAWFANFVSVHVRGAAYSTTWEVIR